MLTLFTFSILLFVNWDTRYKSKMVVTCDSRYSLFSILHTAYCVQLSA